MSDLLTHIQQLTGSAVESSGGPHVVDEWTRSVHAGKLNKLLLISSQRLGRRQRYSMRIKHTTCTLIKSVGYAHDTASLPEDVPEPPPDSLLSLYLTHEIYPPALSRLLSCV